jgi:serine/threonine protein kinase
VCTRGTANRIQRQLPWPAGCLCAARRELTCERAIQRARRERLWASESISNGRFVCVVFVWRVRATRACRVRPLPPPGRPTHKQAPLPVNTTWISPKHRRCQDETFRHLCQIYWPTPCPDQSFRYSTTYSTTQPPPPSTDENTLYEYVAELNEIMATKRQFDALNDEEDICKYYHLHDKKLGEGGFAKVRLATHLRTKQYVAIKCLDKIRLGSELPRIYNEIKCLKKLKHKNIARLYQVFETDTVIYLVLEYCQGGELFDYIVKKSRLSESESAQILFDLMRVLDFIHINGFAHRDLKPENVLFDERHQIKLIDFGLAANCSADNMANNKNQAPLGQLSTCCGSITYAAPEVIAGGVYSGTAVDVWSAGVMMYALLIGQLPFNDNSISKLYQKIQAGIQELPDYLSQDACDLLRKMLTVNPRYRITVRDVLSHPWLRNRSSNYTRIHRRLDFNSSQLDDLVVQRCCELFPEISETQLRDLIRADFNYYSTTYHLLQAKCPPRSVGIVKRSMPDEQTSVIPSVAPVPPMVLTPRRNINNNNNYNNNNIVVHTIDNKNDDNGLGKGSCQPSPTKRSRFVTVVNTPRTPRTPPSYLKRLHETNKAPRTCPSKVLTTPITKFKPAAKKSLVKRLIESATPSKLRRRHKKRKEQLYI